ncbi:type II secretion system protein [Janthinobacterium sp. SUN211]|uniref:type II secretion system protein n=1 Tax=Janthinobacterium sp. SUN211 TaxID=3014786 RepID=UPI002713A6BF|nr:type II secretion system protein [Janthinobacterium sp. SUN211]MDO8051438.1 type II secretion system protein [Janthinobacterium sp. SUN211]
MRHWRLLGASRGFSLIELLAAAAILGVLATVAVPVVQTTMRREKERELRQALRDIRRGIDAYHSAVVRRSIIVKIEDSGYPPRLETLTEGIVDENNRTGPKLYFLRRLPRDPFYPDRKAPAVSTWGKRAYDSSEEAPREGADVFDVYSRSAQMGLNGVPYAQW